MCVNRNADDIMMSAIVWLKCVELQQCIKLKYNYNAEESTRFWTMFWSVLMLATGR